MQKKPFLNDLVKITIKRFNSNDLYELRPINKLHPTQSTYLQITNCCNEYLIFHWIFKDIFPNGYNIEHAKNFLNWAKSGWVNNTHFVFAILSNKNEYVGSVDLKSNNLNKCEIGYWVSESHSGLATNAISNLIVIARSAGYKKLYALTKNKNKKSENVLLNNNFKQISSTSDTDIFNTFNLIL